MLTIEIGKSDDDVRGGNHPVGSHGFLNVAERKHDEAKAIRVADVGVRRTPMHPPTVQRCQRSAPANADPEVTHCPVLSVVLAVPSIFKRVKVT